MIILHDNYVTRRAAQIVFGRKSVYVLLIQGLTDVLVHLYFRATASSKKISPFSLNHVTDAVNDSPILGSSRDF